MNDFSVFAILLALLIGITGSLLAVFISSYLTDKIRQLKRSSRAKYLINKLKGGYLDPFFEKDKTERTKVSKQIRCYFRLKGFEVSENILPFDFFANEDYTLEEFKGFLIPPLNRESKRVEDHESKRIEDHTVIHLDSGITDQWRKYFTKIGQKAHDRHEKTHEKIARRIVFFDKFLLDFFIDESQKIIEYSGYKPGESFVIKRDEKNSNTISNFAQYAIRNAYHVAKIHQLNRGFNVQNPHSGLIAMDTYYYDKSSVNSNEYYDFGLYRIEGISIVYIPIFHRGIDKKMVGDKIYIDETPAQRDGIKEFRDDFDRLWENCKEVEPIEAQKYPHHEKIHVPSIGLHSFSHDFFERTYYIKLVEIFEEAFKWDLIEEKPARSEHLLM